MRENASFIQFAIANPYDAIYNLERFRISCQKKLNIFNEVLMY